MILSFSSANIKIILLTGEFYVKIVLSTGDFYKKSASAELVAGDGGGDGHVEGFGGAVWVGGE